MLRNKLLNRDKIIHRMLSISGQFLLIALGASLLLVLNVLYDNYQTLNAALLENVRTNISQSSQLLNLTVSTHSSKEGLSNFKVFFEELIEPDAKNGLIYIVIGNSQGQILLSTLGAGEEPPLPTDVHDLEAAASAGTVHIKNQLLLPENEIGYLQYGFSTKNIVDATSRQYFRSLLRTLFIILGTFFAIVYLGLRTTRRFAQMIKTSHAIVQGDLSKRVQIGGFDELSSIADQFNSVVDTLEAKIGEITDLNFSLEERVALRTWELENSKKELELSLDQLTEAQAQLIRAEKLASLGSLVAGIAHELNTPIGNAYIVSTTVAAKILEFDRAFESGAVKRSVLLKFKSEMSEASNLLNNNLTRASELITSFKTVAVDRASENRRPFDLLEVVEELAVTLRVQLRRRKIDFQLMIPKGIQMDSYPGSLMQVISNLFNNAVIHGFEHRDEGEIKIIAAVSDVDNTRVEIHFIDNGIGIQPRIIDKIFDPFFTTKLGQGGSGLGLNICYNIVLGILEGQIQVHSVVGVGTRFTLSLPIIVSKSEGE